MKDPFKTRKMHTVPVPLAPEPVVKAEVTSYEASTMLDAAQRRAIDRENALKLFPRLATQSDARAA